jgi:PTS system mannose-specific IIA component
VIGIVIVAHGGLAREYLAALEHGVGKHRGTVAVSIDANDSCRSKQAEVDAAVASVDEGEGVAVVTDIYGSTPSNLAMGACRKTPNRRILYGANLPLLIQLAKGREVNAKSIMGVMLLAAGPGTAIKVRCDGADEVEALDAVAKFFVSGF